MSNFSSTTIDSARSRPTLFQLISGIDRGVEEHVAWSQRLVRCVLLSLPPGEDLTADDAHERCAFGRWFAANREVLAGVDTALVGRIDDDHVQLHLAVRRLCLGGLDDPAVAAVDLPAFESAQRTLVERLQRLRERLTGLAGLHDALTGLPLRHGLPSAFEMRSKDALRSGECLWLAMIDIDHFKAVNDTHGHLAGDLALRHVATCVAGALRQSDVVFRVGGDELLALLLVSDSAEVPCEGEAREVIERFLAQLRHTPQVVKPGLALALTATAGLARVRANDTLDAALGRADKALLQGKRYGRDRLVVAPP